VPTVRLGVNMFNKAISGRALKQILLSLFLIASLTHWAVAQNEQTGTVEALNQDNGFITISGRRLPFSDEVTKVILSGRGVGAQAIDVGMVVRYTTNGSGVLLQVEIIGPSEKLREIESN